MRSPIDFYFNTSQFFFFFFLGGFLTPVVLLYIQLISLVSLKLELASIETFKCSHIRIILPTMHCLYTHS